MTGSGASNRPRKSLRELVREGKECLQVQGKTDNSRLPNRQSTRIFISHASEDKNSFVRPLAEALKHDFDIWYDEYELTIGDSLLKRISDGLASCDFGIVVLSRYFFGKKWPQAELDGLFALEIASRKIILPVWKDVSFSEVRSFSPILAGRLAAQTSEGLEQVIVQIRRAIEVSERTRQISISQPITQKGKAIDQILNEKREALLLLSRREGFELVVQAVACLYRTMESILKEIEDGASILRFRFDYSGRAENPIVDISTYRHIQLNVGFLPGLLEKGMSLPDTSRAIDARLFAAVLRRRPAPFRQTVEPDLICEFWFKPTFQHSKQVAWIATRSEIIYSNEELARFLVAELLNAIENE